MVYNPCNWAWGGSCVLPTDSLSSQSMLDEKAEGGGQSVAISHPHNDNWSVNKNSKVELKMYDVEFEIWRGDWPNVASEYRVQGSQLSQM